MIFTRYNAWITRSVQESIRRTARAGKWTSKSYLCGAYLGNQIPYFTVYRHPLSGELRKPHLLAQLAQDRLPHTPLPGHERMEPAESKAGHSIFSCIKSTRETKRMLTALKQPFIHWFTQSGSCPGQARVSVVHASQCMKPPLGPCLRVLLPVCQLNRWRRSREHLILLLCCFTCRIVSTWTPGQPTISWSPSGARFKRQHLPGSPRRETIPQ